MLPKRSTPVDQNLGSESTHSQLSVAIFRALRNLLVTQKSLMYFQTCQKGGNPCIPPPKVSKTRDIRDVTYMICLKSQKIFDQKLEIDIFNITYILVIERRKFADFPHI